MFRVDDQVGVLEETGTKGGSNLEIPNLFQGELDLTGRRTKFEVLTIDAEFRYQNQRAAPINQGEKERT